MRLLAADGVQCVQPLFELDGDLAPVYTYEKNGVRVEPWYADTGAPFHMTASSVDDGSSTLSEECQRNWWCEC